MTASLLPCGDDIGKETQKDEVYPALCRAQRQKMARRGDNIESQNHRITES